MPPPPPPKTASASAASAATTAASASVADDDDDDNDDADSRNPSLTEIRFSVPFFFFNLGRLKSLKSEGVVFFCSNGFFTPS